MGSSLTSGTPPTQLTASSHSCPRQSVSSALITNRVSNGYYPQAGKLLNTSDLHQSLLDWIVLHTTGNILLSPYFSSIVYLNGFFYILPQSPTYLWHFLYIYCFAPTSLSRNVSSCRTAIGSMPHCCSTLPPNATAPFPVLLHRAPWKT